MELCKTQRRKSKGKILSDITNTCKKPKRTLKRLTKASSNIKIESPTPSSSRFFKNHEFYLSLKETQLQSLIGALKLTMENIKRRYKLLSSKLKKHNHSKSRAYSKIMSITPILDFSVKPYSELSPISLTESHYSASSLANLLDSRACASTKLNSFELKWKMNEIEQENDRIIVKEFHLKELRKELNRRKRDIIIAIGKLYEKRELLKLKKSSIGKLGAVNEGLELKKQELEGMVLKIAERKNKVNEKYREFDADVEERVRASRERVRELETALEIKNFEVIQKENYLKNILDIKNRLLEKSENMKNFDYMINQTKEATLKAINIINRNPIQRFKG